MSPHRSAAELAPGTVLVATGKSHDPDFAHSAVVLIRCDLESVVGLMLNKPTKIPITDLLPEAKGKAIVYAGGPVTIGVRGLVRTKSAPYFRVATNRAELLALIARGAPPAEFRIYAGYVGWTASQLHSEVSRGLWQQRAPDAHVIFSSLH